MMRLIFRGFLVHGLFGLRLDRDERVSRLIKDR